MANELGGSSDVSTEVKLLKQEIRLRREQDESRANMLAAQIQGLLTKVEDLVFRLATLEQSIKPLIDAYEGQQADNRDFNKSIKLALFTALISIVMLSVIGPAISHAIFK